MSPKAREFWKKRLRKQFEELDDAFLAELLDIPALETIGRSAYIARIQQSERMFEDLNKREKIQEQI